MSGFGDAAMRRSPNELEIMMIPLASSHPSSMRTRPWGRLRAQRYETNVVDWKWTTV
jgi:hypothetical protein